MLFGCTKNKKIFSIFSILTTTIFLFAIPSFFAQAISDQLSDSSKKDGKLLLGDDFHNDIILGVKHITGNLPLLSKLNDVKEVENKSAWDEFGVSVFIEGTLTQIEINKEITRDIIDDMRAEIMYDRDELEYLSKNKLTPEEIESAEVDLDVDTPRYLNTNPHPSLDENPNVNPYAAEIYEKSEEGENNSLQEVERENIFNYIGGLRTATTTATATETISENLIFKEIFKGEQDTSATETLVPNREQSDQFHSAGVSPTE